MKKRLLFLVSAFLVVGLTLGMTYRQKAGATAPGVNYLVSSDSSGSEGNNISYPPRHQQVSSDGRYVVFYSMANNLVTGDTNGKEDVFVKDTQTGTTSLVSVSTGGGPADGTSTSPMVSYNGRYVVFTSSGSTNLVTGVSGGIHVFRRDLLTNTTALVDATPAGVPGNAESDVADISADGRFVAFTTRADNLLGTTVYANQVVMKDMDTGAIHVVTKNSSGALANADTFGPSISCDGSIVAFTTNATNLASSYSGDMDLYVAKVTWSGSDLTDVTPSINNWIQNPQVSCNGNDVVYDSAATNLVTPNTTGTNNAYEYNRLTGENTLVSQNSTGGYGNASYSGGEPSVSDDGRFVVFKSQATNLDTTYSNPYGATGANIYVKDMKTSAVELVSISALGNVGNLADTPAISADGSYVTYSYQTPGTTNSQNTLISGLTTGTTNYRPDVYESKTGF